MWMGRYTHTHTPQLTPHSNPCACSFEVRSRRLSFCCAAREERYVGGLQSSLIAHRTRLWRNVTHLAGNEGAPGRLPGRRNFIFPGPVCAEVYRAHGAEGKEALPSHVCLLCGHVTMPLLGARGMRAARLCGLWGGCRKLISECGFRVYEKPILI